MALATLQTYASRPSKTGSAARSESEGLHWIREMCVEADEQLGPVYEHEREALASAIDSSFGKPSSS